MIVQDRTGPERNKAAAARPADAASLILWRQSRQGVEVLMGLRSRAHRFMPGVLVFPEARLDPADRRTPALT
ncbi:NUDIX hydrolase, partial [Roseomonas mucosa]